MDLSVVVRTLNGRDRLDDCLDELEDLAVAEVVVVNGPSTDGTSGLVREHPAVDVLVEVAERNPNVARNAGAAAASGDAVAFLDGTSAPEAGWADRVRSALADGADAVAGPVHHRVEGGVTTIAPVTRTLAGREVTFFDGDNLALSAETVEALDGFDEYLPVGGARDAAHRLAALDCGLVWAGEAAVMREGDGNEWYDGPGATRGAEHRALAYRLAKNYGVRPATGLALVGRAGRDALAALRSVLAGERTPTGWVGEGRDVLASLAEGTEDGLRARAADAGPRRNPNGLSARMDRAVATYDC